MEGSAYRDRVGRRGRYLVDISGRLGMLKGADADRLVSAYGDLTARLKALVTSLERAGN